MTTFERRAEGLSPRAKDLRGEKFGMLTALGLSTKDKHRNAQWVCLCDCGATTKVRATTLLSGNTRSCGCLRKTAQTRLKDAVTYTKERKAEPKPTPKPKREPKPKPAPKPKQPVTLTVGDLPPMVKDLEGGVFTRLTVTGYAGRNNHGKHMWHTLCQCGMTGLHQDTSLTSGKTKSCGCLKAESSGAVHPMRGTPEYISWVNMWRRCTDPKAPGYHLDKTRVPPESWRSFDAFLDVVGARPTPAHRLVRIDKSGSFSPSNMAWMSPADRPARRRHSEQTRVDAKIRASIRKGNSKDAMKDLLDQPPKTQPIQQSVMKVQPTDRRRREVEIERERERTERLGLEYTAPSALVDERDAELEVKYKERLQKKSESVDAQKQLETAEALEVDLEEARKVEARRALNAGVGPGFAKENRANVKALQTKAHKMPEDRLVGFISTPEQALAYGIKWEEPVPWDGVEPL